MEVEEREDFLRCSTSCTQRGVSCSELESGGCGGRVSKRSHNLKFPRATDCGCGLGAGIGVLGHAEFGRCSGSFGW
ncbi:hypothetical protein LINPERHAP2_LOCUS2034 [Linum perenne]